MPPAAEPPKSHQRAREMKSIMDILIVEDSEKRTAFFRQLLGNGRRPRIERSGTEAIKALYESSTGE